MHNGQELNKLVNEALSINESLEDFIEYPPISNSKEMLDEILKYSSNKDYLLDNIERLNVGLLAAKSLDF